MHDIVMHQNTGDAYRTDMLTCSKGIVKLFKVHGVEAGRLCIKIPSTWEGLEACRILQTEGTTTLATTLFTIEQAALAGEVGCHFVAPYVNELKVHFEKE
jgi:transaldolase